MVVVTANVVVAVPAWPRLAKVPSVRHSAVLRMNFPKGMAAFLDWQVWVERWFGVGKQHVWHAQVRPHDLTRVQVWRAFEPLA
jgi:hypothetical protein